MIAEILSIGSELMAGRIADTNAAFLSEQLARLGFQVTRHTAVGDSRRDIVSALREAAGRARVVVATGGLGPTPDDLTREAFAEFLGVGLVEHPQTVQRIREVFAAMHMDVPGSNYSQACIPPTGEVILNPIGTAAGFSVASGTCRFFCLPGVPGEMSRMYSESVEPALRGAAGRVISVRCLHAFGVPESRIGEELRDLMGEGRNPEVATQASEGIITIRLTATGPEECTAVKTLDEAERQVTGRLGSAIFGKDGTTLAVAVGGLLERRGLTVAIAESCTGGELAARLTDVPGISRFFLEAVVTYSNESKVQRLRVPAELIEKHGAVSAQVARAMAEGMRKTSGADVAVGITGIAGPTGGTPEKPVGLVYIALADSEGTCCKEVRLAGERVKIRDRAVKMALDMVRRYLMSKDEDGRLKH